MQDFLNHEDFALLRVLYDFVVKKKMHGVSAVQGSDTTKMPRRTEADTIKIFFIN